MAQPDTALSTCECEHPQNVRGSARCGRCGRVIDLMAWLEASLRLAPKFREGS